MPDSLPPLLVEVIPRCSPDRLGPIGQALLHAVSQSQPRAVARLVVVELVGEQVLLGRFQRAASAIHVERCASPPTRRSGGGRAIHPGRGEGALAVLFALPTSGHFLPAPVGADKILNRYLRGIMAGLGAHYFGRDYLSADRRALAIVSQDALTGGAQLIEVVVGITRPLDLPPGLHAYPPHHDPRAAGPPSVTLAELEDPLVTLDQLVDRLARGHARLFGCAPERRDVDPTLLAAAAAIAPSPIEDEAHVARGGLLPVPIGFVEALVRTDGSTIAEARLRGDLVAPAFAVERLEASLAGCPITLADIGQRVDAAFRPPAGIIGVTDLSVIARAVFSAAAAAGARGGT